MSYLKFKNCTFSKLKLCDDCYHYTRSEIGIIRMNISYVNVKIKLDKCNFYSNDLYLIDTEPLIHISDHKPQGNCNITHASKVITHSCFFFVNNA